MGFILGMQGWFNKTHQINRMKEKKHIIISDDAESTLDEIQHPYMTKTFHKLVIVGKYLKKIKAIYEKLE